MAHQAPQNLVIVGGGIAGVSTAYFASISKARQPESKIVLVEASSIAAGASGYSGGFLAKDWHGAATESISAMSFDLHKTLAEQYDGKANWGYRPVETLSLTTDALQKKTKSSKPPPIAWVPAETIVASRILGDHTTTAQVHPGLLTKFLCEKFLEQPGTELMVGSASQLQMDGSRPTTLTVEHQGESRDIPTDGLVLAAGPWTGLLATKLLGTALGSKVAIRGNRAHSIVLKTQESLSATCLFTDMSMADGRAAEPEVYARPDGTTYICGESDNEPLPALASSITPSAKAIKNLHSQSQALSPVFDPANGATIIAEQCCYLPMADRGRPLIGKVKGVDNIWVGGGLSCWGITQGPGTGLCLSELILEGKVRSADISRLAP